MDNITDNSGDYYENVTDYSTYDFENITVITNSAAIITHAYQIVLQLVIYFIYDIL